MLPIKWTTKPGGEGSSEGGGGREDNGGMVACPKHLVLADLSVAKSIGQPIPKSVTKVKIVGQRSQRQLGKRIQFCVKCNHPIAIYGRLSPCTHVFCLDCSKSDPLCYLCDVRIEKIQTIKMMEVGIFICGAPRCYKSFLEKNELRSHICDNHQDLINDPKIFN